MFVIGIVVAIIATVVALVLNHRSNIAVSKEFWEIHRDPEWKPCPTSLRDENGQCTCLMHQEVCIPYARTHRHSLGDTCLCIPQKSYDYYYRILEDYKNRPFYDWRAH